MATYPSYWAIDGNGNWSTAGDWWTYVPNSNPPPDYDPWFNLVPGADDDVNLTPTSEPSGNAAGTSPFTITYNTTDTIASLSGPSYATLAITGGKLTIINALNLAGALDISGGTLDVENTSGGPSDEGARGDDYQLLPALDLTGGTLEIDSGSFVLIGDDVISGGNVTGAGDFYVSGFGALTIEAGAEVTASTFELGVTPNGTTSLTTLNTNFSYSGNFLLDDYSGNNAVLDLNSYQLTLSGTVSFSGTINGAGTLILAAGTATTFSPANYSGFYALGGVNIINKGTITEIDNFQLDGTFDNQSGGMLDFTTDSGITNEGSVAVTNEGTIEMTVATGTATIYGSFTTAGTIDAVSGTIAVNGSGGSLGGTIEGAGGFSVQGGGSYTLATSLSLTVASFGIDTTDGNGGGSTEVTLTKSFSYAGAFAAGSVFDNTDLDLAGYTMTLTGSATLTGPYGYVNLLGGGAIMFAQGSTSAVDGTNIASGVTLENAGAFAENGNIYLDSDGGSAETLFQNDAKGVVTLGGTVNAFNQDGTSGLITNAGTFQQTTATGNSDISVKFNTTGTVSAQTGQIYFYDGGSFGGTLSGAGTIVLRGSAGYTLGASVNLSVANFGIYDSPTVTLSANLTYAGSIYEGGQFSQSTLDLAGYTLTLTNAATFTAPYGNVYLTGGGELSIVSGATASIDATDLAGGITIVNAGTVNAGNDINFDYDSGSGQSLFSNTAAGTVDVTDGGTIFEETGSSGLVANAGLFDKVASAGQSDIYVAFNNTGTLEVDSGSTLVFHDGATLGGTVTGQGTLILRGGPTYTLAAGLKLNVSNLTIYDSPTITLAQNISYGGVFFEAGTFSQSTLNLAGYTFTFTNSLTFTAGYGAVHLAGGGELAIASGASAAIDSLLVNGGVTVLNSGTVTDNGNIYLDADGGSAQSVFRNTSTGVVDLGGLSTEFTESGASGLIANAGLFDKVANTGAGTIYVALNNTGTLEADTGSTLALNDGGTLGGTISGAGTVSLQGGVSYTLAASLSLTVSYFNIINSPTVTLSKALTYAGTFYESGANGGGSTLDLAGFTLALTNAYTFTAPYSVINMNGGGGLSFSKTSVGEMDSLDLAAGMSIQNAGVLTDGGNIELDSDGKAAASFFTNTANGVITLDASNTAFAEAGSSGSVSNAGKIDKIANTGTSDIRVLINNTGTLEVDTGSTLALDDGGTLKGTISGAGAFNLQGSVSYTLATGVVVSVATFNIVNSPTVTLNGNLAYSGAFSQSGTNSGGSTLDLNGHTLSLSGSATFTAPYSVVNITGGGAVAVAKGATGSIAETNLVSGVTFTNAGTLYNYGYVVLDSDGGSAASAFSNQATGILDIDNASVIFSETGTSGLLKNLGLIEDLLTSGESDINVAVNSTGTLKTDGGLLALRDGGSIGGTLSGVGEIAIEGGSTTIKAALISVANFDILDSAAISVQGAVADTGGFDLTNGSSLGIASGYKLALEGASTISGKIGGAGSLLLAAGTTTINSGGAINAATLAISGHSTLLDVDENLSYAGAFSEAAGSTVNVASGDTFAVGGVYSLDGVMNGAGIVHVTGSGAESGLTIGGALALQNYADLTQSTLGLTLGDATGAVASFSNAAAGIFDIIDNTGIALGAAKTSSFSNFGLLEKTAGTGTSAIAANVGNAGTISVISGLLDLQRAINGTGAAKVGAGATLEFDSTVAAGQTVSFSGSGGKVSLDDLDTAGVQYFHGTISGFASGDTIDAGAPFGTGTTAVFTENQAGTGGTLALTDGAASASIALTGSYVTGNFVPVSDGANGTMFTYHTV